MHVLTCLPSGVQLHGLPTTNLSALGESVHAFTCPLSQFSNKSQCSYWYPALCEQTAISRFPHHSTFIVISVCLCAVKVFSTYK